MEEQIQEIPSQPVQPETAPVLPEKKFNLLTIVIPACRQAGCWIAILLIAGAVFAGIQIGKKQTTPNQQISQPPVPTSLPTQVPASPGVSQGGPTPAETVYTEQGRSANWETYNGGFLTLKYPRTWRVSVPDDKTVVISSGLSGRSELLVGEIDDKNDAELKKSVLSDFNEPPRTRRLLLGSTPATEYYGCSGVEGCMWVYKIVASKDNRLYFIKFTVYPDQPGDLYNQILSTFRFLELTCEDKAKMGIKVYSLPTGWTCEYLANEDGSGTGILSLSSEKFSIKIGSMDVGLCEGECENVPFYTNKYFDLALIKQGKERFIFEILKDKIGDGTALLVKLGERDLTISEKSELIKVIGSIKLEK